MALTNHEVQILFLRMVTDWFGETEGNYSDFVQALLTGDKKAMNVYINRVALQTFRAFDTGKRPSGQEPERFYHGFVLGLIAKGVPAEQIRKYGFAFKGKEVLIG